MIACHRGFHSPAIEALRPERCPEHGTGAALVLPFCNTEAMQLHLNEIATKVSAGAHAILILDQAGWHGAKELKIPTNTRSCGCRRAHPSSTAKKISGNSCARIGYRTGHRFREKLWLLSPAGL